MIARGFGRFTRMIIELLDNRSSWLLLISASRGRSGP